MLLVVSVYDGGSSVQHPGNLLFKLGHEHFLGNRDEAQTSGRFGLGTLPCAGLYSLVQLAAL